MARHRAPGSKLQFALAVIALIALVMSAWLLWSSGVGRYSPAESPLQSPSSSSLSSSVVRSPEAQKPTPTPTPTPEVSSAPKPIVTDMIDPVGKPLKLRIIRSNRVVVPFDNDRMVPSYLEKDRTLEPEHNKVGWYAEAGWPLPGVKSSYRSIVVGHVSGYRGKPDVFASLPTVRVGDIVEVQYPRMTISFRVTDSFEIPKTKTQSDDRVWTASGAPGRLLSVITCDPGSSTFRSGPHQGRLSGNWVVLATRIS